MTARGLLIALTTTHLHTFFLPSSKQIEQAWEEEMQKATAIARNRYEEQMSKVQLVENETIQGLEDEFATLLAHERESMKGAREIRAQRRKEEEERLEIMRKKMQEKKGTKKLGEIEYI